jgi:hypothetical protein
VVPGPDTRIDQRNPDARAGERRQAGEPRLHLVGSDRGVRHGHERPDVDVAGEMIDLRGERFDSSGTGPHHGALNQCFLD